jgi:hypothetical protein
MPSCDDALEAVGVAQHPVGHVAAVACAQRALARLVDEGIVLLGVVKALHQIGEGLAAPVAVDAVDDGLPVARRAAGIDHHHDVAVGGKQLGVPAIAPRVAPVALRPAVDEELERIFFGGIEAGRANEKAFELGTILGGEPEAFHLGQVELGEEGVVEVSDLFRLV